MSYKLWVAYCRDALSCVRYCELVRPRLCVVFKPSPPSLHREGDNVAVGTHGNASLGMCDDIRLCTYFLYKITHYFCRLNIAVIVELGMSLDSEHFAIAMLYCFHYPIFTDCNDFQIFS